MIYRTNAFILNCNTLQVYNSKGSEVRLHRKEFEILQHLCEDNTPHRAISLYETIWDSEADFNCEKQNNLVRVAISNIRKTLGKDCIATRYFNYFVD
jgi:DNA-binding response OmpR family regulator